MTNLLIGIAVVALLAYRQLSARQAKETSSARLVLILGVIGVVEIVQAAKGHTVSALTVGLIAGSLVAGGLLGALRGLTVKVWRDGDGVAWRQGNWTTVALWIVALAVHLALDVAIDASTAIHSLGTTSLLLYLAISLGAQREIVRYRAAELVS